jgi:formyl-CoA transferase
MMSITGPVEGPPSKVGVAVVDVVAGQNAVMAILAALHERQISRQGQYIDIALLDSQIAWLVNVGSNYLISGVRPERYGNAHPNIVPYETFPTSDGWIALGVGNDIQWRRLCQLTGWDDLASDERFMTNPGRVEQRHVLVPALQERFRGRSTSTWTSLLRSGGVPCAPINAVDEALAQEQVLARGIVTEVPHPTAGNLKLIGSPLRLSRSPTDVTRPPPLLGQHTEEVLTDLLGLSRVDIERLRDEGVV